MADTGIVLIAGAKRRSFVDRIASAVVKRAKAAQPEPQSSELMGFDARTLRSDRFESTANSKLDLTALTIV